MATDKVKTEDKVKTVDKVKMVDLTIPKLRSANAETQKFISVNGESFLIKRGETVKVPEYIAEAYYNSEKAKDEDFELIEKVKAKMPTE